MSTHTRGYYPRIFCLFLGLNTLLCALAVKAQEPVLTLKDAVLQAVETHPQVQADWNNFIAAGEEVSAARSGYLPSVDLSAAAGRHSRDYDDRGSYNAGSAQVSLTQMLFDGFRTKSSVERFDSARWVRYFELLDTIETIALETARAYEDVSRQRELVALARDNYAKHRSVLQQIDERVSSGVGRRVDLEQVSGRLALAESNLLIEASNLHDVTARYLRVVGNLPPTQLASSDLEQQALPADIQQALQMAYQGNPGFHAAIKNISAAQAAVSLERSGFYPKVELRARQNIARNNNSFDERFDPNNYGDESAVELALTYNLYGGGYNRASVRRSLAQVNQAKDIRDQACIELRQTTQIAYNDSQRIAEQLFSLDQHRLASNKVRSAYAEQFTIGQRTLLDLLDAENEYFQASRAYVNAVADNAIAHARTLAAMGKLLPALGIVRDSLTMLENIDAAQVKVDAGSACPTDAPVALGREDLISEMTTVSADTLFAFARSDLNADAIAVLDRLVRQIKNTEKLVEISIAGHSDAVGTDAINIPLSKARAQRVRDYFILNGLESANIRVNGYGAAHPVADNDTELGRAANRRVEVTITRKP